MEFGPFNVDDNMYNTAFNSARRRGASYKADFSDANKTILVHRPQLLGAISKAYSILKGAYGNSLNTMYPTLTVEEQRKLKKALDEVESLLLPYNEHKNTTQLVKLSSI